VVPVDVDVDVETVVVETMCGSPLPSWVAL
jgi:hypothetical protein